jgi:ParB family chromosome partitioning protein
LGKNNVSSLLTFHDDLFTTQEERDTAKRETVLDIPLSEISDFPNHPFKVRMDDAMMEMADSIRQYGVLVPGMVRQKPDGGYEMIAGHRRKMASELAQKETMPCLVRDLSDDEAIIIMIDSNLQRETLLPSEKAFAYRMKLEAMKRQGQRTDLTSYPMEKKLKGITSAQQVGEKSGDSQPQIYRYIRLTYLIPPLLDMVDEGKVAMRPAVELSYLPEKEQNMLHEMIKLEDCTPSHAQAIKMRRFAEEGKLSEEVILSIMQEEKPNQKEQFRMPRERISKYFPAGTPAQKIEDTIIKALELYQRQRSRDRER